MATVLYLLAVVTFFIGCGFFGAAKGAIHEQVLDAEFGPEDAQAKPYRPVAR